MNKYKVMIRFNDLAGGDKEHYGAGNVFNSVFEARVWIEEKMKGLMPTNYEATNYLMLPDRMYYIGDHTIKITELVKAG